MLPARAWAQWACNGLTLSPAHGLTCFSFVPSPANSLTNSPAISSAVGLTPLPFRAQEGGQCEVSLWHCLHHVPFTPLLTFDIQRKALSFLFQMSYDTVVWKAPKIALKFYDRNPLSFEDRNTVEAGITSLLRLETNMENFDIKVNHVPKLFQWFVHI